MVLARLRVRPTKKKRLYNNDMTKTGSWKVPQFSQEPDLCCPLWGGGPSHMWYQSPSLGPQEHCSSTALAHRATGPSPPSYLKIHCDALKLKSPVQVQLQRDRAHICKDKGRSFRPKVRPHCRGPADSSGPIHPMKPETLQP